MNRIIISGNLTKDGELLQGPRSSILSFRIACSDFSRKKTDGTGYESMFFNVTAFGALAERILKDARRGCQVLVDGRVRQNTYKSQGVNVTTTEIIADNIEIISKRDAKDSTQPAADAQTNSEQGSVSKAAPVEESKNLEQIEVLQDDLPF